MRPNWFIGWPCATPALAPRLAGAPPGVRRLGASDYHLTLAFLGAVDEATARATFAGVPPSLAAPVDVRLGRVRLMGHPRRGTALAATLTDGADVLAHRIAAHRAPLLDAAGARPDDRRPLPHLTIARIHRRAAPAEREAGLAWASELELGDVTHRIDALALYTWSDERPRRQYRQVERITS